MPEAGPGPNDGYGKGYALITVSLTFALAVVVSILGGRWLDRRLGTAPLFLLLGLAFGLGVGATWAWQRIKGESGGRGGGAK